MGLGFQFPPEYSNWAKVNFETSPMAKMLKEKKLKPQIVQMTKIKNLRFLEIIDHRSTETLKL
ncbi:hypothetical protein BROSI_A1143 [Candidatus Brocadia sinica JPN1]|uniref:Uncharacterized protein n=1 Tax=Candidatus Brocadia sinica JPN1 TaxID=1197129 RepID=A0ABQ0JVA1_9BACT|nr:hypothetical protein BROSI_A1143 [Candidatus Brocadia sinica JPN1]GIK13837.1 MAG: hypothetical protein BroJett002_25440 [Candidatus Brocadia sinica]GJQ16945.1 MAG: hypothetical protein HBSIN01_09040 [Candidatus Brocadia sinica]